VQTNLSPLEVARVLTLDYPESTTHWLRMSTTVQLIQQGMVANDAWLAAGAALAQLLSEPTMTAATQGDVWEQ